MQKPDSVSGEQISKANLKDNGSKMGNPNLGERRIQRSISRAPKPILLRD